MLNLAQVSARLTAGVVLALWLFSSPSFAADDWVCGKWTPDPTGKCVEKRVCTKTTCKDIEDLTKCTKETRTECAKEEPPPKPPSRFNGAAPPVGGLPSANDPGPGAPPGPANPSATTAYPYPDRKLTCLQVFRRLVIRNLLGQRVPKGALINWRLASGSQGNIKLRRIFAPNDEIAFELPPADWNPNAGPCQAWASAGPTGTFR